MRNETKSIIITTNLSFNRWEEIFIDPTLTAAMVDRLAHKATVINIKGDSYRIKETKEWLGVKNWPKFAPTFWPNLVLTYTNCKCQYKKERKCAYKIPYLDLLDECFSLSLIL